MSNWSEAKNLNQDSVSSPSVKPTEQKSAISSPAVTASTKSSSSGAPSPLLLPTDKPIPVDAPTKEHADKDHHHHHHHLHMPKIHSPFSSPKLQPVVHAFDAVLDTLAPEVHTAEGNYDHKKTSLSNIGRAH